MSTVVPIVLAEIACALQGRNDLLVHSRGLELHKLGTGLVKVVSMR